LNPSVGLGPISNPFGTGASGLRLQGPPALFDLAWQPPLGSIDISAKGEIYTFAARALAPTPLKPVRGDERP